MTSLLQIYVQVVYIIFACSQLVQHVICDNTNDNYTCPAGFMSLPSAGGCYSVIFERLTWDNARVACKTLFPNSRLAVVQNEAQNTAIVSYVMTLCNTQAAPCIAGPSQFSIYLAGQRKTSYNCSSNIFVWKLEDNVTLPMTYYNNWYKDEPNCAKIGNETLESCLDSRTTANESNWNDRPCEFATCPLCQYTDKTDCLSSPCQNNGTCVELISGYVCGCPHNYLGDHCEIDTTQKSSNSAALVLSVSMGITFFVAAAAVAAVIICLLRRTSLGARRGKAEAVQADGMTIDRIYETPRESNTVHDYQELSQTSRDTDAYETPQNEITVHLYPHLTVNKANK